MSLTVTQRLLQQEKARRSDGSAQAKIVALLDTLSEEQRAFITDKHRFKVACCPRRAGKSRALSVMMLVCALKDPKSPILFLGITRESAKVAVWQDLLDLMDQFGVSYEARISTLQIKLMNGSLITLFGGDVPQARHKLRGRKHRLICVDESAFVGAESEKFDELVNTLAPSLADYQGTLALASSPGEVMKGLFYEAFAGNRKSRWSQHTWDMLKNPYFMRPSKNPAFATVGEEELSTICDQLFGGDWEHLTFLREYRGKYVKDNSRTVYPYAPAKNIIEDNTPIDDEQYGIGIDLGVASKSAIVVGKFSQYSKEFQVVETWAEPYQTVDQLVAEIVYLQEKYNTIVTIADTGGLGAATVQEIRRRYSIPILAAEKQNKQIYQRIMAADIIAGFIKIPKRLTELLDEWDTIIKDENGDEVKGVENHISDALLYLYRHAYTTHLKHAQARKTTEEQIIDRITEQYYQELKEAETDY